MEKSVYWSVDWPASNNYLDEGQVTFGSSEDEDRPGWLADNSWPANKKKEDRVKVVDKKEEKLSAEERDSDESWLRQSASPVRHEMKLTTQPFEDFDYKLYHKPESVHQEKVDRTLSCCSIMLKSIEILCFDWLRSSSYKDSCHML